MPRYFTARKRETANDDLWDSSQPVLPHPQVFVGEPIKTGLLDKSGIEIYRLPDRIGFLGEAEDETPPAK